MPHQKITQAAVRDWRRECPKKPYDIHDTELKGFVARVRPSGTVTYLLKYDTITGKSRNFTIGRDGKDGIDATSAREDAQELKHSVRKGGDPQKERRHKKADARLALARTLGAYFEDRYKPHHLKKRSDGGAKEAERILRKDFGHLFDKSLADITTDDVESWQTSREGDLDSETVRRIRAELESLFTHAQNETGKWQWLSVNPIAALVPIKAKSPEDLKPRYLSEPESKRLAKAMRQRDQQAREKAKSGNRWRRERGYELKPTLPEHYTDHLEVMVIVALKTGLRRNELFSLEWQDIEPDYSAINVRASTTKTKRARIIPLAKPAREALEKWRSQTNSNHLVFSNNGKKFDNVNSAWKNLLNDAKIQNFRWHDMRHDFASQLVIRNVSIEKVSKLLGHTDIKTTQRYAHLSNASLEAAVQHLD